MTARAPVRPRNVAVVGPGTDATAADLAAAETVGTLLATAGCVVVTGGGDGVMAAAARGARRAGGLVVALLPGSDPNAAVGEPSVVLPTGLGELRNGLVVGSTDAIIAVGGSWGTASEIALAMRAGTPVVSLAGWEFVDIAGRRLGPPTAPDAAAAVDRVLNALAAPVPGPPPSDGGHTGSG